MDEKFRPALKQLLIEYRNNSYDLTGSKYCPLCKIAKEIKQSLSCSWRKCHYCPWTTEESIKHIIPCEGWAEKHNYKNIWFAMQVRHMRKKRIAMIERWLEEPA